MELNQDFRHGRHCTFDMHVHLVFVTKYRRGCLGEQHMEFLHSVFGSVCQNFECILLEFNGECNHVHLLVSFPPKVAVSKLVNSLKCVSSRLLKKQFGAIHPWYKHKGLWSASYFASTCGGAPLTIIKQYIESQNRPD